MKTKPIITFIIAILVAFIYLFPFSLVLINSFKDRVAIIQNPILLPANFDLSNFNTAFDEMNYLYAFMNSAIITITAGIILIVFPAMLAYYLVRFEYRANKPIFIILVMSMIIPFQALMIPFVSNLWHTWHVEQQNSLNLLLFGLRYELVNLYVSWLYQNITYCLGRGCSG